MKKVLIISPVPTHPTQAGNRLRILQMVELLKELNYSVDFLYTNHEGTASNQMLEYWGEQLIQFKSRKKYDSKSVTSYRLKKYLGFIDSIKYNNLLDDWYDENLTPFLKELQAKNSYHTVLVEYIFLSKALESFGSGVNKILDTHDRFGNRYQFYLQNNETPEWFSTFRFMEKKAICRANKVIAIQNKEKKYFEELSKKLNCFVLSGLYKAKYSEPKIENEKLVLGFFASSNPINRAGILKFIQEFGEYIGKDFELNIYGTICKTLAQSDKYLLYGIFDSVEEVYSQVDVVINPVDFGTGYKMKIAEALHFSKPVITTAHSAIGFEEYLEEGVYLYQQKVEFLKVIEQLNDTTKMKTVKEEIFRVSQELEKKNKEIILQNF